MKKFVLIAGPCVIESQDLIDSVAEKLKKITSVYPFVEFYFKSSFDKANRSAHDSFRGPGLEKGLMMLEKTKKKCGVATLTDIHETAQCKSVAESVNALQIPAFLCRQTDLINEASAQCKTYGRKLNIKKGQFLAPWDMGNIVEKVKTTTGDLDPQWLWLTERGTSFGYNNLVVDMTSFPILQKNGVPVIFDVTHSVQLPGGAAGGKVTGGRREFIPTLARAAMAVGIDGLFMEVHPDPSQAKSDAANAFPLDQVEKLLETLFRIREVCGTER